ncbi:ESPR domain-containing protein, partial [Escherichia coli]|nr:ESPR domain-containing protein [Escherichia coli]
MKRHLNTSYRLVWNHIMGTLEGASELARSRGKRAGVADCVAPFCAFFNFTGFSGGTCIW